MKTYVTKEVEQFLGLCTTDTVRGLGLEEFTALDILKHPTTDNGDKLELFYYLEALTDEAQKAFCKKFSPGSLADARDSFLFAASWDKHCTAAAKQIKWLCKRAGVKYVEPKI